MCVYIYIYIYMHIHILLMYCCMSCVLCCLRLLLFACVLWLCVLLGLRGHGGPSRRLLILLLILRTNNTTS